MTQRIYCWIGDCDDIFSRNARDRNRVQCLTAP